MKDMKRKHALIDWFVGWLNTLVGQLNTLV